MPHVGDSRRCLSAKVPLRWAPMTRYRLGKRFMVCYRCSMAVLRTAAKCPRCGCVAFKHPSIPPFIFCPAFDEKAKGPIKRLPTGLLELGAPQADRYLDVVSNERGRRIRPKGRC